MKLLPHAARPQSSHPALSLLWTFGILALSLALPQVSGILFCIMATLVYAVGHRRLPLQLLLTSVRLPAFFAVLATASLPIEVSLFGNEPFLQISGTSALQHAGIVLLRSLSAILAMVALFLTERIEGILATLVRVGVPVAVVDIAFIIYGTIYDLAASLEKMQQATDARLGFSGLRNQVRSAGVLAAGLWLQALVMARSKQIGLSTRGLEAFAFVAHLELPRIAPREFLAVGASLGAITFASRFLEGLLL